MSTAELDTYLLTNWKDLEAATSAAYVIENAVYEALAEEVRRWAEPRGWSGVFNTDLIWLAPPEWTIKPGSRPSADAYFQFGYHGSEEDSFALTSLMGLNQDVAGFDFYQTRLPARFWKPKATSPEILAALPGFSVQAGGLFHAFGVEHAEVLEAAGSGDYAQVINSVRTVMDNLGAAVPVISRQMGPRS